MYYIYKYISNNQIVYIGKTSRPVKQRIKEHSYEPPFQQLINTQIYYSTFDDEATCSIAEIHLIDKYKPSLNRQILPDKSGTRFDSYDFNWQEYNDISVYEQQREIRVEDNRKEIGIQKLKEAINKIQNLSNQMLVFQKEFNELQSLYETTKHHSEFLENQYASYKEAYNNEHKRYTDLMDSYFNAVIMNQRLQAKMLGIKLEDLEENNPFDKLNFFV